MSGKTRRGRQQDRDRYRDFDLAMGKLPPQNLDAEEAILGACMLISGAFSEVSTILTADAFYTEQHRILYKTMVELSGSGHALDIITVSNRLKANGDLDTIGGPYALTQLTAKVASGANIEFHARIVLEAWVRREMIRMGSIFIAGGFDDGKDSLESLNDASIALDRVYELLQSGKMQSWGSMLQKTMDEIVAKAKRPSHLAGISTGYSSVDAITGGRVAGDLIILAARPSAGKTTRMLNEIIHIASRGIPVGVVSLEMAATQLVTKIISNKSSINSEKLRRGQIDEYEIVRAKKFGADIAEYPIHISDISNMDIFQLRVLARNWVKKFGVKALYVDYLQLLRGDPDAYTRDQEVGTISRALKQIAKELDIPVIALSQLSRAVDTRPKKEPMLSDLRESGNIEQDADVVEFLYRPDYYGITEDETGQDIRGQVKEIVAKNRNGGLDTTKLKFMPQISMFIDISANEKGAESGYYPTLNVLPNNTALNTNQEDDEPF